MKKLSQVIVISILFVFVVSVFVLRSYKIDIIEHVVHVRRNIILVIHVAQKSLKTLYMSEEYNIPVIRTRMFAYLNPRRLDLFATSFARQVARIERGLQEELVHGNLDSVRTIIDVRDAMRAYWDAALYCTPGEAYNIGGKTTITVGSFLDLLKSLAKAPIPSRVDPALLRPADVTLQIPSTEKFDKATGWKPQYSFEESVAFLLDHWRRQVVKEGSLEAQ